MILTRIAHFPKEQVESTVAKVEQQVSDKILCIRYSSGEDWAGDPALFFRILLKDEAIVQGAARSLQKEAWQTYRYSYCLG